MFWIGIIALMPIRIRIQLSVSNFDAIPHTDPTRSYTIVGKCELKFLTSVHSSASLHCFSFSSGQYIEVF
jgi:hypothetical protein